MSKLLVFADESATSPDSPCYGIGALVVPSVVQDAFVDAFDKLRGQHGVAHELKWNDIGSSHGSINFVLDWMGIIQQTNLTFGTIVVHKGHYRLWSSPGADREEAFYKTYTLLMNDLAKRRQGEFEVYIDRRTDRYEKHDEVMEKITNYMLARIGARSKITHVTKSDSKLVAGIQIADVLTGAITASHREYLAGSSMLRRGKRLLVNRLAMMLGWDALWYDTMPNSHFNIWHFPPEEFRARPRTREVRLHREVPYVKPQDLASSD